MSFSLSHSLAFIFHLHLSQDKKKGAHASDAVEKDGGSSFLPLVIQLILSKRGFPQSTPQPFLLHHGQDQYNGQLPYTGPEQRPGRPLFAVQPPHPPSLLQHPRINDGTSHDKCRISDVIVAQSSTDWKHGQAVPKGHSRSHGDVRRHEHLVSRTSIFLSNCMCQCEEVGELPGKQDPCDQPPTNGLFREEKLLGLIPHRCLTGIGRAVLACGCTPAHERRNGSHDGPHPRIDWMYPLQCGVGSCIYPDVGSA